MTTNAEDQTTLCTRLAEPGEHCDCAEHGSTVVADGQDLQLLYRGIVDMYGESSVPATTLAQKIRLLRDG